jgi:NAD(P)H-dependent FMN reductase
MWKREIEVSVVPLLHLIHTSLAKAKETTDPQAAQRLEDAANSVLSALVIVLRSPKAMIPAALSPYIDYMALTVTKEEIETVSRQAS